MKPLPILFFIIVISGCETKMQDQDISSWLVPRVIRSVLDQRPRMATVRVGDDVYLAYDTEKCSLYKLWRGGVHWDGAAFNNVKTVQPESWGNTYLEENPDHPAWKVIKGGESVLVKVQFKGYSLQKDPIVIHCELVLADGTTVKVSEQPLFNIEQTLFRRIFEVKAMAGDLEVFYRDHQLANNETTTIDYELDLVPMPKFVDRIPENNANLLWLDRSGCNTCHEMQEYTIGPAYQQIAARYEKNEDNLDYLVQKVKSGGSGVWGETVMNPHPQLTEGNLQRMVNYILSLKPRPAFKKKSAKRKAAPEAERPSTKPGFGAALEGLHPSLQLSTIRPSWFKPRVGGMDFLPDGSLLVSTWDSIGAVYRLSGVETGDTNQVAIQRIAAGLSEPLGLKVVEEDIFVLQKHELTQLIDLDGDYLIDEYRTICNGFDVSADFHEFSYGLAYQDGAFYATLGLAMRLMEHEVQLPDRGTAIEMRLDGSYRIIADGVRQPNGIGFSPQGDLFITENQGQWVPACKIIHVQEGHYYGCQYGTGDRYEGKVISPPAVWMPQDEIGNSPGQPVFVTNGTYQGQMLYGEVTHGGLKRAFLEKINGQWQGCVFRFTQGLEAGINRLAWGPDGALYVGGVGMNGNWGWRGNQYGLQRLAFADESAFEMLAVRVQSNGFEIELTEALHPDLEISAAGFQVQQWRYEPTRHYGGPKLDLEELEIQEIKLSSDRKKVALVIPGLKEGFVVYFRLSEQLVNRDGERLWSGEVWYTLNKKV